VRRRRSSVTALALVVALGSLAASCGDDADGGAAADRATTSTAPPASASPSGGDDGGGADGIAPRVAVAETELGEVLVDGDGFTLYLFTPDERADGTTCLDACAEAWPPLAGSRSPVAGAGIDADLVDAFERPDGGLQAEYAGWPLYRFAGDAAPGDVEGHGSGGVWLAVRPDGEPVPVAEGDRGRY
jgi:predicted lipoprotein with Yx(FWY)xxD motif